MSIGTRGDRVTVTRKTRTKRADGGYDTTLASVGTYWAEIKPVRALEGEEAGRQHGQTTYQLVLDSRLDIKVDDILRWKSWDLNVREVRVPPSSTPIMVVIADYGVIV